MLLHSSYVQIPANLYTGVTIISTVNRGKRANQGALGHGLITSVSPGLKRHFQRMSRSTPSRVRPSVCPFFTRCESTPKGCFTCITAPAHPYATDVVYTALLNLGLPEEADRRRRIQCGPYLRVVEASCSYWRRRRAKKRRNRHTRRQRRQSENSGRDKWINERQRELTGDKCNDQSRHKGRQCEISKRDEEN